MTHSGQPPKQVLVFDDMPMNVQVLGEFLSQEYRLRAATCGEDTLAIATSPNSPDIILLDVMMPGMGAYEVLYPYSDSARHPTRS